MNALITYEGQHRLARVDARQVLADMSACMQTFDNTAEPTESLLMLDMRDTDPALEAAYDELARDYGTSPRLAGTAPTGEELRIYFWPIPKDGLDAAFDQVAILRARGRLLDSRVGIKVVWDFRFRDPATHTLLPGQEAMAALDNLPGGRGDSSSAVLTLGRASSVAFWFLLPFEEPDATFIAYVRRLQAALPARLSPRGWRRWTLAQAGEWRARKLSLDL